MEAQLDVDFDDMLRVVSELASVEYDMALVNYELASLRARLADAARKAGLPQSHIERVVQYIGLEPEDRAQIELLVKKQAELKRQQVLAANLLDIMRDKIRVWQTKSANSRKL